MPWASSWRSGYPTSARLEPKLGSDPARGIRRQPAPLGPRTASPMDDLTRAVLRHIDPQELVDLASALIRIPSFKTEETPVALFLEEFFRERGYDVELQEI